MADINEIVQVAVDAYKGNTAKYSVDQSMDSLRQALVAANGGSTKLDYKNIRDGKCVGLFSIIETILSRTVVDGLQGDEYCNSLAEFINVGAGDQNTFAVEDSSLFVVSEAADGTQGIRRQRLGGYSTVTIPTSFKVVKFYEEANRVLSGQVDLNHMITKVSESFRQQLLNDLYSLWISATADDLGGNSYFSTAGSYDEEALLNVISHVEAAAGGKPVTIVGTKTALRHLAPSIIGAEAKSDIYNMGYCGKFFGSNVVATPQRHKVGTTDFVMDDKTITLIAGDDKPLKVVYEGQSTIIVGDPSSRADLTHEYLYGEKYGMGLVLAGGNAGIGRYTIAA